MSKVYIFAGVAALLAFGVAVNFYLDRKEQAEFEERRQSYENWDTTGPPPELVLEDENFFCTEAMEGIYDWAMNSYEGHLEDEAKLNASYEEILSRQEEYGISLVDNKEF